MSKSAALLRLARISNLPTVWSNVLAASVLAGGAPLSDLAPIFFAMSALYTGGMFLNDAFDREIDAGERPERPLPMGEIAPLTAWAIGGGLLAAGVAGLAAFGLKSALAGFVLASLILIYDAWHKKNPLSPLIMGACRALVYVGTALAVSGVLSASVLVGASALLLYVLALTALAKRGFRHVGALIAGIALLDAGISATVGDLLAAAVCVGCFGLALLLQRIIPGT